MFAKLCMRCAAVLLAIGCMHSRPAQPHDVGPVARTDDTVDHVFGIDVVDPYRWMETATAERDAWLTAQSESTTKALAGISDHGLAARAYQLDNGASVSRALLQHGRLLFTLRTTLATRDPSGSDRALVVPKGGTTITDYKMSPDGSLVCYELSQNAEHTLFVLDIATGKQLPDVVQDVYDACQWLEDGKRFYYISKGAARVHVLGQSADEDVTILDRTAKSPLALNAHENAWLFRFEHSSKAIATISAGHDEVRLALSPPNPFDRDAQWQTVANYGDSVVEGFVHGDRIYLVTFMDTPNFKLVSVPLASPDLAHARSEIVDDPDSVIDDHEIGEAADAMRYFQANFPV